MISCLGGGYPPPKQEIRTPKRPNDFSFFSQGQLWYSMDNGLRIVGSCFVIIGYTVCNKVK